ncbi:hypothetical protein C5F59_027720 [Streptomyces sp. QL37]|uniref:hypothetical protein n=1 Tax=Streptomyces sp. QL37 TaxID=2093747 RepID=UPI001374CEF8|nr:hypothetical protein [Streptomyces sp. QL37]
MTVLAFICLAVGLYATGSAAHFVFADPTVDTYRPVWADRLALTGAALLMLLGGTR